MTPEGRSRADIYTHKQYTEQQNETEFTERNGNITIRKYKHKNKKYIIYTIIQKHNKHKNIYKVIKTKQKNMIKETTISINTHMIYIYIYIYLLIIF